MTPTDGRRIVGKALAAAAALVAAACVTTYEDMPVATKPSQLPLAVPVAIPFSNEGVREDQRLLFAFYGSVFERMQSAAADRDPAQLEGLVALYDREDLPLRLREVIAAYRALAVGLRFQLHAAGASTLTLAPAPAAATSTPQAAPDGPRVAELQTTQPQTTQPPVPQPPPLGTALMFRLELPPSSVPVLLGGRGDDEPTGFAVAVTIDDTFLDGSTRSSHTQDFVWLPAAFQLAGGNSLQVPVEVAATAGDAVQRVVHVRVDLMPGYVTVDGQRAPVHRTGIGACTVTQWPKGHEVIAKAPLNALRAAIRSGDPARAAQIYLGAAFVRGDERDEAVKALIELVRFGRPDQATVAMSALRLLTGENLSLADREAWLAWWQARR